MKNYLKKAIILLLILFCAKTLYASALDRVIEQMSAQKTESAAKAFFGYDNTTLWMLIACAFISWNLPKLAEEIAKEFEGAPLGGSVGKGAWGASTKLAMGAATVGAGLASKAIDKFGKKGKDGASSSSSSAPSAGNRTFSGAPDSTGADTASGGSKSSTGADANTGGVKGGTSAPGLTGIPLTNKNTANDASSGKSNNTGTSASSGSNTVHPTAEDDINEIYGGDAGFIKDILQQSKKDEANKANAANGTKTGTEATKSAGADSTVPKGLASDKKGQDGKDGKSKLASGLKQTAGIVGKTAKTVGKAALTATLLTSVAGVGILAAKALSPKDGKNPSGGRSFFGLGKKAPAGSAPDPNSVAAKQNQKPETPGSDRKDDKQGQKQPEMPGRDRVHEEIAKLNHKIDHLKAEVDYKVNNTASRLHSETITISNQTKNATEARTISVKSDLERNIGLAVSRANEALNKSKKGG